MNSQNDNDNNGRLLSDFSADKGSEMFSRKGAGDREEEETDTPVSTSRSIITDDINRSKQAETKKTIQEVPDSSKQAPTEHKEDIFQNEEKSKPPLPIVAAVMIGVLVIGIICGMLLWKDKGSDNDKQTDESKNTVVSTEEASTAATEALTIEEVSEAVTASAVATKNETTEGVTETQPQEGDIPDEYKGFPNVENAPLNMAFYDSAQGLSGTVMTDNTGLNLRKGPDTTFAVIKELPKSSTVWILGETAEWFYVGIKADENDNGYTDVGYVSKEYVAVNVKSTNTE